MRGQCYDGASNMSGARSGCKSLAQQEASLTIYCHCAAHCLILVAVSACNIQAFKNAESCIDLIARFFHLSSRKQRMLDMAIDSCDSTPKAKKLKDACRMWWIERIDSYSIFLELLPAVHTCLQAPPCFTSNVRHTQTGVGMEKLHVSQRPMVFFLSSSHQLF